MDVYERDYYKVIDFRKSRDYLCQENYATKNHPCADDVAVLRLDRDLSGIQVAHFTCER